MKAVLTYILAFSGIAVAVALAADQLLAAHKKNQMPHLTNNAMLLAGCILAVLGGGFTVFAFTGTLGPLVIFASIVSIILGAAYAWRFKRRRETDAMWEALMAEEERQARETAAKDPANAAAWARLAHLKEKRGDPRGALDFLEKACALEPTQFNKDRLERLREAVAALPPPAPGENGGTGG